MSHRTDPGSVYRRGLTRHWWAEQAPRYDLVTSEATLNELLDGSYPGQEEAIELVQDIPRLEIGKVEHITVVNRRLGLMTPVILSPELLWAEEVT